MLANIVVGIGPGPLATSPDRRFVYVPNEAGALLTPQAPGTVSVISTISGTVTATITVGPSPYFLAVSPDGDTVYSSDYQTNTVSVISTATNQVTSTIPGFNGPCGVVVSPDGSTLYVVNFTGGVAVVSTATNRVTNTITGLGNQPYDAVMTPDGRYLYVTNFNTSADYVPGPGSVSVIDTATATVTDLIDVGLSPDAIAITPDGRYVYVSNADSNTVSVISAATNDVDPGGYQPVRDGRQPRWQVRLHRQLQRRVLPRPGPDRRELRDGDRHREQLGRQYPRGGGRHLGGGLLAGPGMAVSGTLRPRLPSQPGGIRDILDRDR